MKIPNAPPQESVYKWNEAALSGSFPADERWKGPAASITGEPSGFSYRYLKRPVDVILSVFALLFVLSWLLPLLCILIIIDTGGPAFFIQKRIGRRGKPFCCIKLRTMRKGRKGGKSRPTRLGYWLRCHKLDEIPQFFNVLKGEMSIVGPRPHMLSDHLAFSRLLGKRYNQRHAVLPGITGLAQVRGYEGQVSSIHKLRGRIRFDLFYIRHWSMALEFRIMYQTIRLFARGLLEGLRSQFFNKWMAKNGK